jgi:hypothetical protein
VVISGSTDATGSADRELLAESDAVIGGTLSPDGADVLHEALLRRAFDGAAAVVDLLTG